MKYFILSLVFGLSLGAHASIDKKVEKLMSLTGADKMLSKDFIEQSIDASISQLAAHKGLNMQETSLLKQTSKEQVSNIDYELLRKKITDLYSKTYTKKELNGMIKFYKSKVGKKVIAKTPALTMETQRIVMEVMQNSIK